MALISVRHFMRLPVGVAHRYLSRFAASGGTTLVRVRFSGSVRRVHAVTLDERPTSDGVPTWRTSWRAGIGLPSAAGTLCLHADERGNARLEFKGACAGADDAGVTGFRRANALAHAYLALLDESIEATLAA